VALCRLNPDGTAFSKLRYTGKVLCTSIVLLKILIYFKKRIPQQHKFLSNPVCGNKFVTVSVCGKYVPYGRSKDYVICNIRCTTLYIMVCIMFVPNMERTASAVIL
jgi:hypothetical protein